ncbi:hypothetical protein L195_g010458 [Trifolium pratense]|uniref:Uncharacterized protein n=1 Tax=Trifolium pratense TaxID=57577 RepID=A0A2K3PES1_TRIPR|nr:hypothetical protein L195_g010458 [Trifolium pratense]
MDSFSGVIHPSRMQHTTIYYSLYCIFQVCKFLLFPYHDKSLWNNSDEKRKKALRDTMRSFFKSAPILSVNFNGRYLHVKAVKMGQLVWPAPPSPLKHSALPAKIPFKKRANLQHGTTGSL